VTIESPSSPEREATKAALQKIIRQNVQQLIAQNISSFSNPSSLLDLIANTKEEK